MSDGVHGVAMEFDAAPTRQIAAKIRSFDQIPDIMTMEIPPIEYLVDGMISRKTITLWTGTDGTAKTYLLQKMSIAVAMGGEFLGRRCQRAPVLYLDYENPSFAVRERLDLMAGGPIGGLKVWGTWLEQQPPQISHELLLTIAKDTKPLIVIDPFRYAHGAEENDSTEMMRVMQCLRYCAAAGGAVVILHHPAKTEGSTGRGSTAIKGAADVSFLQEMSDETGLITLACNKNRFGERHSVTIQPNYDEGTFTVTNSEQFTKRAGDLENLGKIIEDTPGLTQNALWKKSGMMKNRFVKLLKENSYGLWREEKDGNAFRYFPPVLKAKNFTPPREQFSKGEQVKNSDSQTIENSEDKLFSEERTGQKSVDLFFVSPPFKGRTIEQPSQKPNGKAMESCPNCGGFAIYPNAAGGKTCETCEGS
jgi:AAA domain-containing protein